MSTSHEITIQIGAKMSDNFKRTVDMASRAVQSFTKGMGLQFKNAYAETAAYTGRYTKEVNKISKSLGVAQAAQNGLGLSNTTAMAIGATTQIPDAGDHNRIKPQNMFDTAIVKAQQQVSQWQDKIHASSLQLEDAFSKDAISAKRYASELNVLTTKLKATDTAQQGLSKARSIGHSISKNAGNMASAGTSMVVQGAVAAATLGKPISDAMKFESAMADVRKVVDFDTPQQFKQMNQDILQLTRSIPMSATEIATLVASAGQAGIEKTGLLDFAEAAGKMGVAFDISAEQAGDMMAKWRTSFKMGQNDVNDLADKVNYLGNTTAASAPAIADVVTRIGPLGDIGGVASGEIAALGASMVGSGVQSEVAATGIKNLILGLTVGEGATKSQAAAFTALGLDASTMAKRMQTDAKGAIMDVFKALKGLDADKRTAVLSDLFGKESIQAISPLLSNLDALQNNFDKVANKQNYAGSVDAEYAERVKTTKNQMELLRNAVSEMSIKIGNALLPAVGWAANELAFLAKVLTDFADAHPDITQYAAIFTGLVLLAPVVQSFVTFAWNGFMIVVKALRIVGTAFNVLRIIMMANPIIAIITAIAVAAYLIYAYWEPIKAYMSTLWDSVKQSWSAFTTWCGSMWDSLIAYLNTIVYEIITWFTSMWDTPAGALLGFIGGPITGLIVAAAWVIDHWTEVSSFTSTMWEAGKSAVYDFANSVEGAILEAYQWVMDKWNGLKEFLSHPIDAVVNFVKGGNSEAAASGGTKIGLAKGGIFNKGAFLTWFAEDSEEAAIPINGSKRSEQLWIKTGQLLGMLPTSQPIANYIQSTAERTVTLQSSDIAKNAKGGIYRKGAFLTWFAEESDEVALPIDGSRRSEALWNKAGQMLGLLPTSQPTTDQATNGTVINPSNHGSVKTYSGLSVSNLLKNNYIDRLSQKAGQMLGLLPTSQPTTAQAVAGTAINQSNHGSVKTYSGLSVSNLLKNNYIDGLSQKAGTIASTLFPITAIEDASNKISSLINATSIELRTITNEKTLSNDYSDNVNTINNAYHYISSLENITNRHKQALNESDIKTFQSFADGTAEQDIQALYRRSKVNNAEINLTFSPQITVTGNADRTQIEQVLRSQIDELKSMIEQITKDNWRVQYD
ncbi:phage tail tape measure protein [Veillonella magna]|uniref:phage tail tape measure protein n=1 Tax=Veillonella magna TaxID=464322 RepID=UPI0023F028EC|nr:phage tail tape measure protein [Veillonella magna]